MSKFVRKYLNTTPERAKEMWDVLLDSDFQYADRIKTTERTNEKGAHEDLIYIADSGIILVYICPAKKTAWYLINIIETLEASEDELDDNSLEQLYDE